MQDNITQETNKLNDLRIEDVAAKDETKENTCSLSEKNESNEMNGDADTNKVNEQDSKELNGSVEEKETSIGGGTDDGNSSCHKRLVSLMFLALVRLSLVG